MRFRVGVVFFTILFVLSLSSQEISQAPTNNTSVPGASVPRLVKFSATVSSPAAQAQREDGSGPVRSLTFGLYAEQTGGTALWTETQTAQIASDGKYTVMLGAATRGGVPAEMFSSGEARWLEVNDGATASRYLLVSVPYALKAEEADRLAGKSLSDFVLSSDLQDRVRAAIQQVQNEAASKTSEASREPINSTTTQGVDGNGSVTFTDNSTFNAVIITQNGAGGGLSAIAATGLAIDASSPGTTANKPTIMARATGTSGTAVAVTGQSAGSTGIGVYGQATGTTSQNIGVKGDAAGSTGRGVAGAATSSTGNTIGVLGTTASATGVGVQGQANVAGGKGVYGTVPSGAGTGVAGEVFSNTAIAGQFKTSSATGIALAAGTSGTNFTVNGQGDISARSITLSTGQVLSLPGGSISTGTGVFSANNGTQALTVTNTGSGNSITANNTGVSGSAIFAQSLNSATTAPTIKAVTNATGLLNPTPTNLPPTAVFGYATTLTDAAVGVTGKTESPEGAGVLGIGVNQTAGVDAAGVIGISTAPDGVGVNGMSTGNGTNGGAGVVGEADGDLGVGVIGKANSTTTLVTNPGLFTVGVYGETQSEAGVGVFGFASNSVSGSPTIGVAGRTDSDAGIGVNGHAFSVTGSTVGVRGQSDSDSGTGVVARNLNSSGSTFGIRAIVASPSGIAGKFVNQGANGQILSGANFGGEVFSVSGNGTVTATAFVGDGSGLTNLPGGGSGTPNNTPNQLVQRDGTGSFSAQNISLAGSLSAATLTGNGSGITNLSAANISPGPTSGNFSNTIVQRDGTGSFSALNISASNFIGGSFTGSGAGLTGIPNTATSATSSNFGNTIVERDNTGSFTAGNITANAFVGDGSGLTGITQLGGVAAANYARRDAANTFSNSQTIAGNSAGNLVTVTNSNVSGTAISGTGITVGVYGESSVANGAGIHGVSTGSPGFGVMGDGNGPLTWGVLGRGFGSNSAGVVGQVSSASGVAGAFDNLAGGIILEGQVSGVNKFTFDGNGSLNTSGSVTAASFSGNGSGLTNVTATSATTATTATNSTQLGGIAAANYARVDTTNTFAANQNITGNLTLAGGSATVTALGGVFDGAGGGVFGRDTNTTGAAVGVQGLAASTSGIGVFGRASAATGATNGVFGRSDSTNGAGVYGSATATSGVTAGMRGTAFSPNGKGAEGDSFPSTNNSVQTSGIGVYGTYGFNSDFTTNSNASAGVAVRGDNAASGSSFATGVQGNATNASGNGIGVAGFSSGSSGIGVQGSATDGSGSTIGVRGVVTSGAGVAGQFEAATNVGLILRGYGNGVQKMSLDGNGNMVLTGSLTASSISGTFSGTVNDSNNLGGAPASVYARTDSGNTFSAAQAINASFAGPMLSVIQNGSGTSLEVQGSSVGVNSTVGGAGSFAVVGTSTNASGVGVNGQAISGTAVRAQSAPSGTLFRGYNGSDVFVVDGNGNVTGASFTGSGAGLTGITASNTTSLGGVAAANYARLDQTGTQSFAGPLTVLTSTTPGFQSQMTGSAGAAIFGYSSSNSGTAFGVGGQSDAGGGVGIRGENTSATGSGIAVYGTSASISGIGLMGQPTHASGNTTGVYGLNGSTNGTGVWGRVTDGTGSTVAVRGDTFSSSGVAGLFVANAAGGAILRGNDGTSDVFSVSRTGDVVANGAIRGTASGYVFAENDSQTMAVGSYADITFGPSIQSNGWTHSSGTGGFTATVAGLYKVTVEANLQPNSGSDTVVNFRLALNGSFIAGSGKTLFVTVSQYAFLSSSAIVSVNAGDVISAQAFSGLTGVQLPNGTSITITRVQ